MNKNQKVLSIRSKVIISVLLLTSIFTIIFYIVSKKVILKSYVNVENNVVNINIKRVNFAIKSVEESQNIKLKDWAVWDDTYDFVNGKNKDYIDQNLQINGMINLDVNFISFADKEGKIIFSRVIDIFKEEELDSKLINNSLNKYNQLLKHDSLESVISGVITTPYGPAVVSSQPVLHNDESGPMVGVMIMGHFLDKSITNNIGDAILYPVELSDYVNTSSSDFIIAKKELSKEKDKFIQILQNNKVAGYSLVHDLDSKPIAITKVTLPRDFYNNGQKSFNYFLMIIGAMLLLLIIEVILLFEFLIVRRFTRLHNELLDINNSKDLTKRITVDNNDEVGNISSIVNNIFNELYIAEEKEKEAIVLEKKALEELKKHTEETERINQLMIGRELKMIEMKKELEKNKQ